MLGKTILVVGLLLALSPTPAAWAMGDTQYEYLQGLDVMCMRRTHWEHGKESYEKGFERCAEIMRTFVDEYQRRQAESVSEDLQNIGIYYQTYPTDGKLRLSKKP